MTREERKVYEVVSMRTDDVFYVVAKDIDELHERIEPYYDIYDGPFCFHGEVEIIKKF